MKKLLLICSITFIACHQKLWYPDPKENEKTYIIAGKDTIVLTGHIIEVNFSASTFSSGWTDQKNGHYYYKFERAVSSKYPDK